MTPVIGRIVHYWRATHNERTLEKSPAIIVSAVLKPARRDLDDKLVDRDPDDERSYAIRVHVFGIANDDKHDANFSLAPAAGCWTWPEYSRRASSELTRARDEMADMRHAEIAAAPLAIVELDPAQSDAGDLAELRRAEQRRAEIAADDPAADE